MSWREDILMQLPSPHDNEPGALRDDIADELADHLDCAMQRELKRTDDPAEAARNVRARFGNPRAVARRLWFDAMKGQIMTQRIMLATNVLVAAVTITVCIFIVLAVRESVQLQQAATFRMEEALREFQAAESRPTAAAETAEASRNGGPTPGDATDPSTHERIDDVADRIRGLSDNWREAYGLGQQLTQLPPEVGYPALREAWDDIGHIEARQQLLKAFAFSRHVGDPHPHVLDVLHLGMTDHSPAVEEWAVEYLKDYVFMDFSRHRGAYDEWYAETSDFSQQKRMTEAARQFVAHLGWVPPNPEEGLETLYLVSDGNLHGLRDIAFLRDAVIEAEIVLVLEPWIRGSFQRSMSPSQQRQFLHSMRILSYIGGDLDRARIEPMVLPFLEHLPADESFPLAMRAIGHTRHAWAGDLLVDAMRRMLQSGRDDYLRYVGDIAGAITQTKGDAAVPILIGMMSIRPDERIVQRIVNGGLEPLTGTGPGLSASPEAWREWWRDNMHRFDENAQATKIPEFEPFKPGASEVDPGIRTVGGNEHMRYFFIGGDSASPRADGYKLLLVLPGGDGSADFHPFVRNMQRVALGDEWIVAQLIAPVWEPDNPNRIVWPTRQSSVDAAAFPTEDFVKSVIDDVKQAATIDERYIYALAWSSSGPAVYAAAAAEDSPLTGAFIAMSVFHPQNMPEVDALKTRAFYILHSPADFIQMRFPEAAKQALEDLGATVHLETYEGGHGWHGDVLGMISAGVNWLTSARHDADAAR